MGVFGRGALACLAMNFVASPALAFEMPSAWSGGAAPLQAQGYVAPATGEGDPVELTNVYEEPDGEGYERAGILDEVRLGATTFWQSNSDGSEDGVFITGQFLFDPVFGPTGKWYLDVLVRPRPHIGGSFSTDDGTDQIFGGLTWTLPIPPAFFLEGSFGGTVHNGDLEGGSIELGCRVLFRESLGVGARLGERWRIVASVDHSSHANLCGEENDGLTHIGGSIGYRF